MNQNSIKNENELLLSFPSKKAMDNGEKLDMVLDCLKGTLDQEGLVSLVRNIHQMLHNKEIGLLSRVVALEKAQQRQNGWVLGICALGTFIGIIIGWIIEIFRKL